MRILICNFEYPPLGGGGGVITAQLAAELARRHEVTVLTSQGLGMPAESVESGVRVMRAPVLFRKDQATASLLSMASYVPAAIKAGRSLLRRERFDVINTHFVVPTGPVGDALARSSGLPNVLSVHGGDLYDPSKFTSPHRHWLLRSWIRRMIVRADALVGQSTNTLANVARYYTHAVEGIRIPLGIQRPAFTPASRAAYGFADDEVLLITVGRLVARKGLHQLIALMDRLRTEKVRLLIIGTGPQMAALKEDCQRRGIEDKVVFTGHVEDEEKFRLLDQSDIFVSTSQHEGFGLLFVEGMASGLPVVCYDHGGQTDFLEDGKTGYLVHLNDEAAFEERTRRLIQDKELRSRMGAENLSRVEDYFIDRCAERYERVFETVLARRQKPAQSPALA
jgi:glycosyltransferase involved in cell wall biosynthesis